jgi:tRNA(Ile)-lysidine synthase
MVLLHILHTLASRHRWRLGVAHFNHRLRGRSSQADERLVCKAAAAFGLPFLVERAEVRGFARERKLSLEMAARELRHRFLAGVARREGFRKIALAHHADDQVELFFLRLLRGSGSEGLGGMKWRSPSPTDGRVTLVRPLLGTSKEELREFARRHRVRFREDASNACLDMLRNRIRHQLVPLLRKHYQPALLRTTLRVMELVGAEAEFLTAIAGLLLLEGRRPEFARLPVALQRRMLQAQLRVAGIEPDFEQIEQLRVAAGRPLALGPGLSVQRDERGRLRVLPPTGSSFNPGRQAIDLEAQPAEAAFGGVTFRWRLARARGRHSGRPRPRAGAEHFDADRVGRSVVLRHWQPGDRFQPSGMPRSVKLQDLFVNQRIPRPDRHRLIVATTAQGEMFWVEGLRISERFKLQPETERRLTWCWQRG